MRVAVVTPPAPVVTWEEADAHLKLDGDVEQQALVEGMVAAATGHIDGPDGWLGRAIGVQTLEMRLPAFGTCGAIALPYPPAIAIEGVEYVDQAGETVALGEAGFELSGNMLRPAWPASFPSSAWRGAGGETVRVRWSAGYEVLPPAIRIAILMMTGDLFKFRESTVTGTIASSIPMSASVQALLAPFRVWR